MKEDFMENKSVSIGIFTDTHGNLPALKTILEAFSEKNVDEIYHLGDCISMGAYPKECMEILLCEKNNINCILGNHDYSYSINNLNQPPMSRISKEHRMHQYALAGEGFKNKISTLPLIIIKSYFGLKVAYTHYALTENNGYEKFWQPISTDISAGNFDRMFENIDADLIFFGHSHSPCDVAGKKMYVDVGSVGCHKGNFARGVILRVNSDKSYSYERISASYDRDELFSEMDSRGVVDLALIKKTYFGGE